MAAPADMARRGALILLEGVDRCGKSTQAKLLAQHLNCTLQNFPDRTTSIGSTINAYLSNACEMNDQAIHLLFSANRWELSEKLRDLLNQGTHVVLDRYCYSGAAFTAAKEKPGLSLDWCMRPEIGLPRPDVVIFLDISTHDAAQRAAYGEERYEKREFQERVRANFFRIMETEAAAKAPWHVLDATKSIDELHASIKAVATSTIAQVEHTPVRILE
ncbi:thymidylate kinase [Aphanomyces astaci]|uniref:Thymidylate kinase n=1 Tax=Aphanomyces astaci TaxID=112090 RepID=W4FFB1_APHAT|nr:thymidylate kinase [Aphanomyces astaci]ETV66125.1 thymidylate kinase [Aphanomyces astaci]|eukprot:XP_009844314.1 thymidylate kinase [Aphanomyces astaci]